MYASYKKSSIFYIQPSRDAFSCSS